MEARGSRILLLLFIPALLGAGYRTENFVVNAESPDVARQVGIAAEHYRKELAVEWLGKELPPWHKPCPIRVKVGQIGAGGETRFSFFPSLKGTTEVANWDMRIQGSLERILDSVLPHEVSHTIFACHFRRPLPRWADEGAATLAEHESERRRQVLTVNQVLNTRRRIPFKNLLNIKEYPTDPQDIMTLYAEGYVLADLLVQQGGRPLYLKFLADAHKDGWDRALQKNYDYKGISDLEQRWQGWVVAGCPDLPPQDVLLADIPSPRNAGNSRGPIVRGQSPEDPFLDPQAPQTQDSNPLRPKAQRDAKPLPLPLAPKPSQQPADAGTVAGVRDGMDDPERDQAKGVDARHENPDYDEPAEPLPRPAPLPPARKKSPSSLSERQRTPWSEYPDDDAPGRRAFQRKTR